MSLRRFGRSYAGIHAARAQPVGGPGDGACTTHAPECQLSVDAIVRDHKLYADPEYVQSTDAFHPDVKHFVQAVAWPVVADFDETGAQGPPGSMGNPEWRSRFLEDRCWRSHWNSRYQRRRASPDGRFVTTCSGRFGGLTSVASFRFQDDGRLTFVQAVKSSTGKFAGGNQLAVSPDGRSVYAAGTLSGVVACASRNPETGTLTPRGVVPDGGPQGGGGKTNSPAGVTISHDGKFVYVATEDKSSISIFRRNF